MEVQTTQKYLHTPTRKLQLVAKAIKGMKPAQALQTLAFTNKAAALPLSKAIQTVLGNARQRGLDIETLVFKKLEINEGPTRSGFTGRFKAGAKGRVYPFRKKMSHINIVLESKEPEESQPEAGQPVAEKVSKVSKVGDKKGELVARR